ncbi:MAG: AAA family ATPase [Ignavibacteriales bacterium]|nr:AAA family ATPase [Ignavibacteriales bacterium]
MTTENNTGISIPELTRKQITDKILNDDSDKIIILAGPGTGKSHLFKLICEKNISNGKNNNLVLTFINELVDDLSRDLYKLSDVKTLHSFALSLIPGNKKIYLKLGDIIDEDYFVVNNEKIDYKYIFCNMIDEKEKLDFYSKRRKYYDYFSPNCSVYTLIKIFENDHHKIPSFSQILIDEFQDFNKLESTLIDFLAQQNSILVVGDDDQSLYGFKYANPSDIRAKFNSDAFERVIQSAQAQGFLGERMAKQFLYFPSKDKDAISALNSKIVVKKEVFQTKNAYNIVQEIEKNFNPRCEHLPSVLIICSLRSQIEPLEKSLRKKGFKNVDASQKYENDQLIDGINLLLTDSKNNLGWRILFKYLCDKTKNEERFKQLINESNSTNKSILDLLNSDEKRHLKKIIACTRKIIKDNCIDEVDQDLIFNFFGYNPRDIALRTLKDSVEQERMAKHVYKNTQIKIVTRLGSKGLTTDYAFLVNFDDKYLLERNAEGILAISDESICNFLVTITRAKIKTYIFTGEKDLPTYLQWVGNDLVEEIL